MIIRFVVVGKVKERGVRETIDEYAARIKHYARYEEVELKDERESDLAPKIKKAAFVDRARVIALEVDGKMLSSHGLADVVSKAEGQGDSLSFLIGGSYGLPRSVSDAAHLKMSLSAMTLPHRLARVVLAEQVYRAFTILRGEPYSH